MCQQGDQLAHVESEFESRKSTVLDKIVEKMGTKRRVYSAEQEERTFSDHKRLFCRNSRTTSTQIINIRLSECRNRILRAVIKEHMKTRKK